MVMHKLKMFAKVAKLSLQQLLTRCFYFRYKPMQIQHSLNFKNFTMLALSPGPRANFAIVFQAPRTKTWEWAWGYLKASTMFPCDILAIYYSGWIHVIIIMSMHDTVLIANQIRHHCFSGCYLYKINEIPLPMKYLNWSRLISPLWMHTGMYVHSEWTLKKIYQSWSRYFI